MPPGWLHSLAIADTNNVWAWGSNEAGQLGNDGDQVPYETPVQVLSGEQYSGTYTYLKDITDIAAGRSGEHSLAVDIEGHVLAWGIDEYGQLGNGEPTTSEFLPVYTRAGEQNYAPGNPNLVNIIAVSAGAYHSMALEALDSEDPNNSLGRVYTFGQAENACLGNDDASTNQDKPVVVYAGEQKSEPDDPNDLQNIVAISAGWWHSMALDKDGFVYTWGSNGDGWWDLGDMDCGGGRLGNGGIDTIEKMPVLVHAGEQYPEDSDPYLKDIIAISAGESHSMALDKDGFVWTWGSNKFGQLGNNEDVAENDSNDSLTAVRVVGGEQETEYLRDIVTISAGYWHCLAIDKYGTVWTWGYGYDGRLGLDSQDDWGVPQKMICPLITDSLYLEKECSSALVVDEDEITYTINYGNDCDPSDPNSGDCGTVYNVTITDYLPWGVKYENIFDPNYNGSDHTYTWDIGALDVDDLGSVSITVKVNEKAPPLGVLTNDVIMQSDTTYDLRFIDTDIDCWENTALPEGVILVDRSAQGFETSNHWYNAYTTLEAAFERASNGCGSEIWVAEGTYIPQGVTFAVGDGVELYGGFAGTETLRGQRNFSANKTYLTASDYDTITITYANDVVIDGFTISSNSRSAVYADNASAKITNCAVIDSGDYGIKAEYSTLDISYCVISGNTIDGIYSNNSASNISWSRIAENGSDGIYLGNNSSVTIANCIIRLNEDYGVYAAGLSGLSTIKNSWIHHNGTDGSGNGIFAYSSGTALDIRNNTIVYNKDYGIRRYYGIVNVTNNIIWYNNGENNQTYGSFNSILNNCIQGLSSLSDGNINDDPNFAYTDPNLYNFHLAYDSPCIDAGTDPNGTFGSEVDIDNESRVVVDIIDIGADEVYSCDDDLTEDDIYNELDLNADGVTYDFFEVWLTDSNDPNWNQIQIFNLADTGASANRIDLADFAKFQLWEACWYNSLPWNQQPFGGGGMESMGMGMSAAFELSPVEYEPTLLEQVLQLIDALGWFEAVMQDPEVQEQVDEASLLNVIESIEESLLNLQQQYREQQE